MNSVLASFFTAQPLIITNGVKHSIKEMKTTRKPTSKEKQFTYQNKTTKDGWNSITYIFTHTSK